MARLNSDFAKKMPQHTTSTIQPLSDFTCFINAHSGIANYSDAQKQALRKRLQYHLTESEDTSQIKQDMIRIKLAEVLSFFQDEKKTQSAKTAIVQKIEERVSQCTSGFVIGLEGLEFSTAYTFPQLLSDYRQELCSNLGSILTDEV